MPRLWCCLLFLGWGDLPTIFYIAMALSMTVYLCCQWLPTLDCDDKNHDEIITVVKPRPSAFSRERY